MSAIWTVTLWRKRSFLTTGFVSATLNFCAHFSPLSCSLLSSLTMCWWNRGHMVLDTTIITIWFAYLSFTPWVLPLLSLLAENTTAGSFKSRLLENEISCYEADAGLELSGTSFQKRSNCHHWLCISSACQNWQLVLMLKILKLIR